jgi:ferredoxin, 2Fe-2S
MTARIHTITFTITHRGIKKEISTYPHEYRNLMSLLYDKFYIEDFGDCKGIGRCGTCHVKVASEKQEPLMRNRNEQTTLSKMENVEMNSRLSCQILITEDIHQLHFNIVDDGDLGLY